MAGVSIAENKFEGFKSCANEVVNFKLIRKEDDIFSDTCVFHPEMSHQVFGDSESIFGYKDLQVELYYSAAQLITYLNLKYTEKISPKLYDGVHADDIMKTLTDKLELPPGYTTKLDDFIAVLARDEKFKPFGELLHSYKVEKNEQSRQFEIYKTNIDAPGFREYHERLQPFLLWYVDAASYIDADDDRWHYYLLYEKYQVNGSSMYAFAGYQTIYNYYAYPEKIRPRISQVLVLPPFQKQGHGSQLLETFYNQVNHDKAILDITVEDPSENFQRVRDFVDARNCMKLESFQKDNLHAGFSEAMVQDAREKLKINKKQARRIYEILRLQATDGSNPEQAKACRLDVKKRLNIPFQKNGRDFEKLRRALQPDELAATMNNVSSEQRMMHLDKLYEECVTEYRRVLDRLTMAE